MLYFIFVPDVRLSKLEEVRPQLCACSNAKEMDHAITGEEL